MPMATRGAKQRGKFWAWALIHLHRGETHWFNTLFNSAAYLLSERNRAGWQMHSSQVLKKHNKKIWTMLSLKKKSTEAGRYIIFRGYFFIAPLKSRTTSFWTMIMKGSSIPNEQLKQESHVFLQIIIKSILIPRFNWSASNCAKPNNTKKKNQNKTTPTPPLPSR